MLFLLVVHLLGTPLAYEVRLIRTTYELTEPVNTVGAIILYVKWDVCFITFGEGLQLL